MDFMIVTAKNEITCLNVGIDHCSGVDSDRSRAMIKAWGIKRQVYDVRIGDYDASASTKSAWGYAAGNEKVKNKESISWIYFIKVYTYPRTVGSLTPKSCSLV
jgi:hypothetical protein